MRIIKYIVSVVVLLTLLGSAARAQYQSVVCAGESGIAYYVQGWENSTYNWTVEGGTITEDYGDSIIVDWPDVPGEYEITVTEISERGCAGPLKTALVLVAGPEIDIGDDASICDGELFEVAPEGDFASFLWFDGSTGSSFLTGEEGWIGVEVSDEQGCAVRDSLYLTVNVNPEVDLGPDTTICTEEGIILDAGSGGDQYRWSTGDETQQIVVYNEGDQEIWAEVENTYGCTGGDTVLVARCDISHLIDLPTGITPNGDGTNDVWNISALEEFSSAVVEVFDQWGTLVWRSEPGYSEPWDGKNMNGRDVPVDSYHFVIHFNDGSNERYVGIITVIR